MIAFLDQWRRSRYTLIPLFAILGLFFLVTSLFSETNSTDSSFLQRGRASYYGSEFNGRRTASGARFSNSAMLAAHRTLPFGSRVTVTNLRNGRSVVVKIVDRGPWVRGRIIDLSQAAARAIGMGGVGYVEVSSGRRKKH
jgi:rare lipoprotein A